MTINYGFNSGREYLQSAQYLLDMLTKAYPDLNPNQRQILLESGYFNNPDKFYAKSNYAPWEQFEKQYKQYKQYR